MKASFGQHAAPGDEAEKALKEWNVGFVRQPDGTLLVEGNLILSSKHLTRLPDLSNVVVTGTFWCSNNQLTSLQGCPKEVRGDFYCYDNQLKSLKGAPRKIGGGFFCSNNELTSLRHAPASVAGNFYCHGNKLESLRFAPKTVAGEFHCYDNRLATLEHAPKTFNKLKSDFGIYPSPEGIPEHIRYTPETRERLKAEREQALVREATVIQHAVQVRRPLRFRKAP